MLKRALALLLSLLLLLLLSGCAMEAAPSAHLKEPVEDPFFFIKFIDVGQADSILIGCDGHYMLVDGGNVDDSRTVAAVLRKEAVDYLDYIVATHSHEDHVGGLSGALSVCKVGTALAPVTDRSTPPFQNFVKYLKQQDVSITVPELDESFSLGSATITVLAPRRGDYERGNDTSLVLMVQYGENRFLLTGDAERTSEADMLEAGVDLKCDLLKVGHHGSATSTSYAFLNEVMPTYGVISVGRDNSFDHPRGEVLSRLRDADVTLYRTDMQGDILVTSDGESITITPEYNPNAVTNPTAFDGSGQQAEDLTFIGNLSSKKLHRLTCDNLPKEENRVFFNSRADAVAQGYTPCGKCKP